MAVMQPNISQFYACAAAVCLVAQAGCNSIGSRINDWASNKPKSKAPAALGQLASDQYGRPLPGSKPPLSTPVAESAPDITNQTRSHVALAMGEMLESVGNIAGAQEQYENSLKSDPKSLNAALALARVYAQQGRPEAAMKVYQAAEKHHRRNPALFNDKALLLADQKDWPAAVAALRTATRLQPSESKYHNNLGMVLAASGNYEEAYKEFREAVGAGPAHYNIALMLLQDERPEEARNHLERAVAAMPNLQKARQLRVQLDRRPSGITAASTERELSVVLDQNVVEGIDVQTIEDSNDSDVEPAGAVEHAPSRPQTTPAADENNPWARRWVPPKWLR
jgi:tetratricopeptide (TPR) repeat protein